MTIPIRPTAIEDEAIARAVDAAPRNSWEMPELSQAFQQHALRTMFYNYQVTLPGRVASAYLEDGFALVRLAGTFKGFSDAERKKALAMIMFSVGRPFGAYKRIGFWQTLGVNYDAKEGRAQSAGYIPLHMDFDQAENPPEGVALFKRRDVGVGKDGDSLLFDYRPFLAEAPPELLQQLTDTTFSYERLFDMHGVGGMINPHPFATARANGQLLLRYNGKAAVGQENSASAQALFIALEPQFRDSSITVSMQQDDLLLINQTAALHGRLPLQRDADAMPPRPEDDRQLWQCYLRHQRR